MKRIIAVTLLALPFAVISLPKPAAALEICLGGCGYHRYYRHPRVIVEPAPVVVQPTVVAPPATVVVPSDQPGYQQKVWIEGHWEYTDNGRYWVKGHYEYH